MPRRTLSWLFLSAVLMLASCGHQSLESILKDQRATAEWSRAKFAFKEIMQNYVHGYNDPVSDEQLEREFEQYVTLTKQQVQDVIDGQSCVPEMDAAEAKYYMVNVAHQRHDSFFAAEQTRPITGTGSQNMHATFSANILLERYAIDHSTAMPARAGQSGAPFPTWETIRKALTDQATFNTTFQLSDQTQSQQIFAHTSGLNWAQNVTGELFIAPALAGGDIFSPALFAVYLFRPDASTGYSVFLVVSADAAGHPKTNYVGLIDGQNHDYKSVTGFAFTYLSANNNLLSYSVVVGDIAPLKFQLQITTAYPNHSDSPYLTVRAPFAPAASSAVVPYKDIPGAKLIMMIRKGALMRDLIAKYYPNATPVELWKDVGAISNDKSFKDKLAAIGLDIAAGLFEADLWLEKPSVAPSGNSVFVASANMSLKCSAKRAPPP